MAEIKLKATQTFDGIEGFVRKGDVFVVSSQERADKLHKLGFVEDVDQDAPVNQDKPLSDYKVDELKEKAKDLGIEGYSSLLKDELVAAIESYAYTNQEAPTEEGDGSPTNTPARLQTVESGSESEQPKAASKTTASTTESKEK